MRLRTLVLTLLGLPLLVIAQNPDAKRMAMNRDGMMIHGTCPSPLHTADVVIADTANGIAVTFTAKDANVTPLQREVERLANMQKMMANDLALREHVLPGNLRYEVFPKGARLTLTPKDPATLEEFRTQVRARVDQLTKNNCAMVENMMRAMTRV